eukprot:jgi/Chrpa1/23909/Chrysochromulina_OHIO_Genome00024662-RA
MGFRKWPTQPSATATTWACYSIAPAARKKRRLPSILWAAKRDHTCTGKRTGKTKTVKPHTHTLALVAGANVSCGLLMEKESACSHVLLSMAFKGPRGSRGAGRGMASAALDAARASHGRCGRRKDAGALLGTCAPLSAEATKREDEDAKQGGTKRTGPPLQEVLQLQAHMVGDDAAALKKLRGECQPDQRKRCLEVAGAVAALDPELGAALATKGGDAAIMRAVANVPHDSCPHADVLVALASQAARLRLLAIAGHCAQWCAAAPRLSSRVRSAYIKAVGDGPKQAGVYTKLMVNTRIDALVNESLKRSAGGDGGGRAMGAGRRG